MVRCVVDDSHDVLIDIFIMKLGHNLLLNYCSVVWIAVTGFVVEGRNY